MHCVQYEALTNFIADKCTFVPPDIKYLSIRMGESPQNYRRYRIEDGKVTRSQFFVENIPNFDCFIYDINNVKGTDRITFRLIKPKTVDRRVDEIVTIDDFVNLISPMCIDIYVDNGIKKSKLVDYRDTTVIDYVEISDEIIDE